VAVRSEVAVDDDPNVLMSSVSGIIVPAMLILGGEG